MNLRDRLRLLKAAGTARALEEPALEHDRPSRTAAAHAEPGQPPRAALLGGCLDGYTVHTPAGEAFYIETRYPVEYCRGPLPLESVWTETGRAWALLGRVPPSTDLRNAAFLDTETTGLAGGTGTYAFLVGLGFFDHYDFVVRQYFLRDYGEEEALLEAVQADLAPFSALVSFNGKSFDWPLLETRFRLARRRPPLAGSPHLDLLHPARRLWKERLGQCNLTRLEAQILRVMRQGDVPGHLIPQLYFDYLRTGQTGPLADVVLHNRLDILSLVSLAGWMAHMVLAPLEPTPDGELLSGDDLYGMARLFEHRGLLAEGLTCYEAACERGVEAVGAAQAQRSLAQAYKRIKAHDRALTIWESMITSGGAASLYPYVEMAKYHEHVSRDYRLAHAMTLRALAVAERRRAMAGVYGPLALKEWQAVQHRLTRLERKLKA